MKITFVIGTRPELIKVAPLIKQFQGTNFKIDIVNTAQHKELLAPYWDNFDIEPTHVLDVMVPNQTLTSLTSRILLQFQQYIDDCDVKPSLIIAQGDTTTVTGASIVAFYNKIQFAHIEAGLRSFDFENPFPEEYNRKIVSIHTKFHFCPTEISRRNLLDESISDETIYVVGNTVVDSLEVVKKSKKFEELLVKTKKYFEGFTDLVLITCHRRENQGENLNRIISSIKALAKENPNYKFIWSLHPNPNIRKIVCEQIDSTFKNIILEEPFDYFELLAIMSQCSCIITDSGGIQEESPSFNVPVIILRKTTERPEGVNEGIAFLIGEDYSNVALYFNDIKNKKIEFGQNPYGDGKSSLKIKEIIINKLKNQSE